MTVLPFLDAPTLSALMPWPAAIEALDSALRKAGAGSDPARHPPRVSVPLSSGELLLMTAESDGAAGIKVVSVAPGNPAAGLPRIQGLYVLFDSVSLSPVLLVDGTALTSLRTPALSALAAGHLAVPGPCVLVVFGAGPQARGHVEALACVRPIGTVLVVTRDPVRAGAFAAALTADGYPASVGTADAVSDADVVVCATTSTQPVFDGRRLAEHACVLAVGSHEPTARELDELVFGRAERVVVEDRGTALREAGDVIAAIAAGTCSAAGLVELPDLLTMLRPQGISVFKSVGMAWQDLAVAGAAGDRWRAAGGTS